MRRICFVTGTRAEFGLMARALCAIAARDDLSLQIVATGMHLSAAHGRTVDDLRRDGWHVDREVQWQTGSQATATGTAMARLASAFAELDPHVVLVVGDRVEAFAAASAAHLDGRIVAHVHGGDRALGQSDDALRHAITKLAHIHLAATAESAARIGRLGEDPWRIHTVGAPGIDGIVEAAADSSTVSSAFDVEPGRFALLVYHPTRADDSAEHATASRLLDAILAAGVPRVVIVFPNNDPGHKGIVRCWNELALPPLPPREGGESASRVRAVVQQSAEPGTSGDRPRPAAPLADSLRGHPLPEGAGTEAARAIARRDVPRPTFLGLLRDAAFLIGNSSSGIIEAASFGTPVLDVGPRQLGRERSGNVVNVEDDPAALRHAVARAWNAGRPPRWTGDNVYGGTGTAHRIANILATTPLDARLRRKLIAY